MQVNFAYPLTGSHWYFIGTDMRTVITFRPLSRDLEKAFEAFSKQHFGGDDSAACRFIFTQFFTATEKPETRAALAIYANLMPQLQAASRKTLLGLEKTLKKEIQRLADDDS